MGIILTYLWVMITWVVSLFSSVVITNNSEINNIFLEWNNIVSFKIDNVWENTNINSLYYNDLSTNKAHPIKVELGKTGEDISTFKNTILLINSNNIDELQMNNFISSNSWTLKDILKNWNTTDILDNKVIPFFDNPYYNSGLLDNDNFLNTNNFKVNDEWYYVINWSGTNIKDYSIIWNIKWNNIQNFNSTLTKQYVFIIPLSKIYNISNSDLDYHFSLNNLKLISWNEYSFKTTNGGDNNYVVYTPKDTTALGWDYTLKTNKYYNIYTVSDSTTPLKINYNNSSVSDAKNWITLTKNGTYFEKSIYQQNNYIYDVWNSVPYYAFYSNKPNTSWDFFKYWEDKQNINNDDKKLVMFSYLIDFFAKDTIYYRVNSITNDIEWRIWEYSFEILYWEDKMKIYWDTKKPVISSCIKTEIIKWYNTCEVYDTFKKWELKQEETVYYKLVIPTVNGYFLSQEDDLFNQTSLASNFSDNSILSTWNTTSLSDIMIYNGDIFLINMENNFLIFPYIKTASKIERVYSDVNVSPFSILNNTLNDWQTSIFDTSNSPYRLKFTPSEDTFESWSTLITLKLKKDDISLNTDGLNIEINVSWDAFTWIAVNPVYSWVFTESDININVPITQDARWNIEVKFFYWTNLIYTYNIPIVTKPSSTTASYLGHNWLIHWIAPSNSPNPYPTFISSPNRINSFFVKVENNPNEFIKKYKIIIDNSTHNNFEIKWILWPSNTHIKEDNNGKMIIEFNNIFRWISWWGIKFDYILKQSAFGGWFNVDWLMNIQVIKEYRNLNNFNYYNFWTWTLESCNENQQWGCNRKWAVTSGLSSETRSGALTIALNLNWSDNAKYSSLTFFNKDDEKAPIVTSSSNSWNTYTMMRFDFYAKDVLSSYDTSRIWVEFDWDEDTTGAWPWSWIQYSYDTSYDTNNWYQFIWTSTPGWSIKNTYSWPIYSWQNWGTYRWRNVSGDLITNWERRYNSCTWNSNYTDLRTSFVSPGSVWNIWKVNTHIDELVVGLKINMPWKKWNNASGFQIVPMFWLYDWQTTNPWMTNPVWYNSTRTPSIPLTSFNWSSPYIKYWFSDTTWSWFAIRLPSSWNWKVSSVDVYYWTKRTQNSWDELYVWNSYDINDDRYDPNQWFFLWEDYYLIKVKFNSSQNLSETVTSLPEQKLIEFINPVLFYWTVTFWDENWEKTNARVNSFLRVMEFVKNGKLKYTAWFTTKNSYTADYVKWHLEVNYNRYLSSTSTCGCWPDCTGTVYYYWMNVNSSNWVYSTYTATLNNKYFYNVSNPNYNMTLVDFMPGWMWYMSGTVNNWKWLMTSSSNFNIKAQLEGSEKRVLWINYYTSWNWVNWVMQYLEADDYSKLKKYIFEWDNTIWASIKDYFLNSIHLKKEVFNITSTKNIYTDIEDMLNRDSSDEDVTKVYHYKNNWVWLYLDSPYVKPNQSWTYIDTSCDWILVWTGTEYINCRDVWNIRNKWNGNIVIIVDWSLMIGSNIVEYINDSQMWRNNKKLVIIADEINISPSVNTIDAFLIWNIQTEYVDNVLVIRWWVTQKDEFMCLRKWTSIALVGGWDRVLWWSAWSENQKLRESYHSISWWVWCVTIVDPKYSSWDIKKTKYEEVNR